MPCGCAAVNCCGPWLLFPGRADPATGRPTGSVSDSFHRRLRRKTKGGRTSVRRVGCGGLRQEPTCHLGLEPTPDRGLMFWRDCAEGEEGHRSSQESSVWVEWSGDLTSGSSVKACRVEPKIGLTPCSEPRWPMARTSMYAKQSATSTKRHTATNQADMARPKKPTAEVEEMEVEVANPSMDCTRKGGHRHNGEILGEN